VIEKIHELHGSERAVAETLCDLINEDIAIIGKEQAEKLAVAWAQIIINDLADAHDAAQERNYL